MKQGDGGRCTSRQNPPLPCAAIRICQMTKENRLVWPNPSRVGGATRGPPRSSHDNRNFLGMRSSIDMPPDHDTTSWRRERAVPRRIRRKFMQSKRDIYIRQRNHDRCSH